MGNVIAITISKVRPSPAKITATVVVMGESQNGDLDEMKVCGWSDRRRWFVDINKQLERRLWRRWKPAVKISSSAMIAAVPGCKVVMGMPVRWLGMKRRLTNSDPKWQRCYVCKF